MRAILPAVLALALVSLTVACGGAADDGAPSAPAATSSSGASSSGSTSSSSGGSTSSSGATTGCTVTSSTTATSIVSSTGCAIRTRDTSACQEARKALGLSGAWLKISCRVTLGVNGGVVTAKTDAQPDYTTFYFNDGDACWSAYPTGKRNPNRIESQNLEIGFPLTPGGAGHTMQGSGVVGIALNGVPIYGNFAAPGDDIFNEALTFDECAGHPQMHGMYHYHSEPTSITQADANLVGMMRDGYAVYGRKDSDGSLPSLDDAGGHVGITTDSPTTPVYHYHVNEQTSTGARTAGQKQWFLTTGKFHSAPAACTGC